MGNKALNWERDRDWAYRGICKKNWKGVVGRTRIYADMRQGVSELKRVGKNLKGGGAEESIMWNITYLILRWDSGGTSIISFAFQFYGFFNQKTTVKTFKNTKLEKLEPWKFSHMYVTETQKTKYTKNTIENYLKS